jgi:hypothetical protein
MISWKELLQAFKSSIDPCLYIKNTSNGLLIWISWIDDCSLIGNKKEVSKYQKLMNKYLDCEKIGELKEYVGCKIDKHRADHRIMIKQPVSTKIFADKFNIEKSHKVECPASCGEFLSKVINGKEINYEEQKIY